MNWPKVHIIILNWNGKADTLECIASVKSITYQNYEIVVVDNGSTDGSEETIRTAFSDITFIQTGLNLGYAGGNNVGISYGLRSDADYFWLLNNDTIVAQNALTELVETALTDKMIAFVGSKIFFYDMPNRIWFAGGTIDLDKGGVTGHIGYNQVDDGSFDSITDVGYVTGCSLLASRRAVEDIGMIPEEYFLYFEETDWNIQARNKGYRTVLSPRSVVWHKDALTQGYSARVIFYTFRNRLHIVRKYSAKHFFDAVKLNKKLRDEYILKWPEKEKLIRKITRLALFDAVFHRYGRANWAFLK